jgi:hypothetical protein
MAYRRNKDIPIWHWCHNCSQWPMASFKEREDKPPTWLGQSLCEECKTRDYANECQHSADRIAAVGVL